MELLFLAHRIPYPPDKGDKIRSWHMLRHLLGPARVHLGAFVDDPADMAHAPFLTERCASVGLFPLGGASRPARAARGLLRGEPLSIALYRDPAMAAWVARTVAAHPIGGIVAFSGQMAPYLLAHAAGRRAVMDMVDLDSEKWAQYAAEATGPRRWLYAREARRLAAFERAVAARADATLFVSAAEAALFAARAGPAAAAKVHAMSNGVDLNYYDPAALPAAASADGHDLAGPIVAFVGAMDYRANVDAALWFADKVWPRIRGFIPQARFLIVGSKPTPEVAKLSERAGIVVTGRVADVRPYLTAAAAVVAPLRIARGIQNKVLEAMAMARPVVASAPAYEGIDAAPGRDLIVADTPEATAQAVLGLLADPGRAQAIGEAARQQVVARYRWETNLALLDRLFGTGHDDTERRAA